MIQSSDFFGSDWMISAFNDMCSMWTDFNPKFPLMDVYTNEETGDFKIDLALAGYAKEDLDIELKNDAICVSYIPKEPNTNKEAELMEAEKAKDHFVPIQQNIKHSKFSIAIPISSKFDFDGIKINFKDGVLDIFLPLSPDKKPRKLEIR